MKHRGKLSRTMLVLSLLTAGYLCSTSPASALELYRPGAAFGPAGVGAGEFENAQSIAVDESTGAVYVYDTGGEGSIYKFNRQGEPLEFSATQLNSIGSVGRAGTGEVQLAVDNSAGPDKGDIYAANGTNVRVYSPEGLLLSEIDAAAGAPWGEACGVAVDTSGNVYVGLYPEHVNRYSATSGFVTSASYSGSLFGVNQVCNIAANAAGDVYVDSWPQGPVTEFGEEHFNEAEEGAGAGITVDGAGSTLAVDQSTGDVFVNEQGAIAQFKVTGSTVSQERSFGTGVINNSYGVAVDHQNAAEVYASDRGLEQVRPFRLESLLPPNVDAVAPLVINVDKHGALLQGTINPENASTFYQIEYGQSTAYGQITPAVNIGSGSSSLPTAAVALHELKAGSTYHYRLIASNVAGSTVGADHTFSTLPLSPPTATTGNVSGVGATTATLSGLVDGNGPEATYEFELASEPDNFVPVGFASLPASEGAQPVSLTIAYLSPGAAYRYRLSTTTTDGASVGLEGTFTTQGLPVAGLTVAPALPPLLGQTPTPPLKEATAKHHKAKTKKKKKKSKGAKARARTERNRSPRTR